MILYRDHKWATAHDKYFDEHFFAHIAAACCDSTTYRSSELIGIENLYAASQFGSLTLEEFIVKLGYAEFVADGYPRKP